MLFHILHKIAAPRNACAVRRHIFSFYSSVSTFTVSGGCDIDPEKPDAVNVTVRADGFDKLTRIKVEELVGEEWIAYELSSEGTPDSSGRGVDYDGYQIHYDGDGKYGYSFVITITDGKERTFRVVAE